MSEEWIRVYQQDCAVGNAHSETRYFIKAAHIKRDRRDRLESVVREEMRSAGWLRPEDCEKQTEPDTPEREGDVLEFVNCPEGLNIRLNGKSMWWESRCCARGKGMARDLPGKWVKVSDEREGDEVRKRYEDLGPVVYHADTEGADNPFRAAVRELVEASAPYTEPCILSDDWMARRVAYEAALAKVREFLGESE
jgi:hypothetical protein